MTQEFKNKLFSNILANMSDGVLVVGFNGVIEMINEPALNIFGMTGQDLIGKSFAAYFFNDERNAVFTDTILDTIHNRRVGEVHFLTFEKDNRKKSLRLTTSYLKEGGESVGIIMVIHDMTDLVELQDAIIAMERINKLNAQLELRNQLLKKTFGRYLSDDIVSEILDTPDGLKMGGQKRKLTILMSDLRGFTQMCERMRPADLLDMLNHYFDEMYEQICWYGGSLIEFLGDGMLVIFGAPRRSDSHASDAVATAMCMQKRMEEINRWNEARGYGRLAMGIGIHTAEVIVGNIGSQLRTKYGVMGAAVNLTGRIESYTTEGQILISPDTRAAVSEELTFNQELKVSPKGVNGEITIYDVASIGAPYGISLQHQEKEASELPKPAEIRFYMLNGKHVDTAVKTGLMTAVSEDYAVFTTPEPVQLYENIRIDIGQDVYAKIVSGSAGAWKMRFTSKPDSFEAWLRELQGSAAAAQV